MTPVETRARAAKSRVAPAIERVAAITSLRAIIAALGSSARSIEGRTGLTNAQLFLVRQLAEVESMSVNALAERARTGQNTVSTVLARLVRAGLVRKSRSVEDGRRVAVSLTARARQLLRRAPTPPTAMLIDAIDTLSADDVRALATGLTALGAALGIDGAEPPLLFEHVPRSARRGPGQPAIVP